jgi:hypothetical protein
MKSIQVTANAGVRMHRRAPDTAELKARKEALERGERTPSRVFCIEQRPDGTFSRVAVDSESQRRRAMLAPQKAPAGKKHLKVI